MLRYANGVAGTGNITVSTANAVVRGSGTSFTTQLQSGYILRNAAGYVAGTVSTVANNTYATMSVNSKINMANLGFQICNLLTDGSTVVLSGNLYTGFGYYGGATYYGNGYFTANSSIASNGDVISGNYVFTIKDRTQIRPAESRVAQKSFIDPAFDARVQSMFAFQRSNMISNLTVVKAYHPPVRDSITGLLVDFPATIYDSGHIPNVITRFEGPLTVDGTLPAARFAANLVNDTTGLGSIKNESGFFSNANAWVSNLSTAITPISSYNHVGSDVKPIDVNVTYKLGKSVWHAQSQLHNSQSIRDTANGITEDHVWRSQRDAIIAPTIGDRMMANLKVPLTHPRITDSLADAKAYYNTRPPYEALSSDDKTNMDSNQDASLRMEIPALRRMRVTGAMIATPGVLNAYVEDLDPGKLPLESYRYTAPRGSLPIYTGVSNFDGTYSPDKPEPDRDEEKFRVDPLHPALRLTNSGRNS
jgi:hypothetical protein